MDKKLGWIGFAVGVVCVLLAALAYRISWELPEPNPDAAATQPAIKAPARPAASQPRSIPLQRIDGPPASARGAGQQERPTRQVPAQPSVETEDPGEQ